LIGIQFRITNYYEFRIENADVCSIVFSSRTTRIEQKWAKTTQNGKKREKCPFLSQAVPGALARSGTNISVFDGSHRKQRFSRHHLLTEAY
jgi:hypothetical protein